MTYCMARMPNAGLANRLFPWARAKVFSKIHGIPMLETVWCQLKIGPILRGEKDNRCYFGLFNRCSTEISGLKKTLILLTHHPAPGPQDFDQKVELSEGDLFVFSGWEPWFKGLMPWNEYIRAELLAILSKKWTMRLQEYPQLPPIGMHIRGGDFMCKDPNQSKIGSGVRTSIDWFVECLTQIRRALGRPIGAFVVTDSASDEMKPILSLGGVELVGSGSAITDMLLLSKAKLILGSGGSTFSGWASYLGNGVPILALSGLGFQRQFLQHDYVSECDAGKIPDKYLRLIK